jgi:hypothetical protein
MGVVEEDGGRGEKGRQGAERRVDSGLDRW